MARRKQKDDFDDPQKPIGGIFRFLVKWILVLGLWLSIIIVIIAAWYGRELSEMTRSPQLEHKPSITVLANDGSVIARYGDLKGDVLSVKDMPKNLIHAVLAIEDRRFYYHFGIDPIGLVRAVLVNLARKGVVQGGSTITQQLAKNLFLSQERTYKRKIQEALLALWLERELTKDEILGAYLNLVYLGAGSYGVEAASQVYFKKSAKNINLYESAVLAGLLKAPSRFSPLSNPKLAQARAKTVLAAMVDANYITEKEAENAKESGAHEKHKSEIADSSRYFGDWVVEQIDDLVSAQNEDIIIKTTFDPEIQKAATESLVKFLDKEGAARKVSQGTVVVMRNDGAVLSIVGGRDYSDSQFNRATQGLRSPGSSFKPVVYLTALEMGWNPDDIIEDSPIVEGKYKPTNFDGDYYGPVPLSTALALSLNTVSVKLAKMIGIENVVASARKMGITTDLEPNLSLALGSSGVPALEMTAAYSVIANRGLGISAYGIEEIKNKSGKVLYLKDHTEKSPRVFSRSATNNLAGMMQNVINFGTGQRARVPYEASGKTGTSQDYRDAWFIGFTPQFVASVWVGNDDNSSMKRVTGGSIPAAIWQETITAAHNDPTPAPNHSIQADDSAFESLLGKLLSGFEGQASSAPQNFEAEPVPEGRYDTNNPDPNLHTNKRRYNE